MTAILARALHRGRAGRVVSVRTHPIRTVDIRFDDYTNATNLDPGEVEIVGAPELRKGERAINFSVERGQ